jgi:hypothetical protein
MKQYQDLKSQVSLKFGCPIKIYIFGKESKRPRSFRPPDHPHNLVVVVVETSTVWVMEIAKKFDAEETEKRMRSAERMMMMTTLMA